MSYDLHFSANFIEDQGTTGLSDALKSNQALTEINMSCENRFLLHLLLFLSFTLVLLLR